METFTGRAVDALHNFARGVPNGERDGGRFFTILTPQLFPTGVRGVVDLFCEVFFGLVALLLQRLQVFCKVIGEYRAIRRVIG